MRMQAIERGTLKPLWSDYNDQKRYQVREVEVGGVVVSRLVKKDTNLKILPFEDTFEELFHLHVSSGHSGRDIMKEKVKEKYANVTQEVIMAFLKTCEFCSTKQTKSDKKKCSRETNLVKRCLFPVSGRLYRPSKLPRYNRRWYLPFHPPRPRPPYQVLLPKSN